MRIAGYIRTSMEDQYANFSLDAQERAIAAWAAERGDLVHIYRDEAQSARTIERDAFRQMRRDAAQGEFDVIVVHKFDRLSRDRRDSLAIKSIFRYDYGIGVYSVTEPSEDTSGEEGAFVEGLLDSIGEWFITNTSEEMAKGKRERAQQGLHNNVAPFGMKKDADKVLIPNEEELPGLLMAFKAYATGKYSDSKVASLLNEAGYRLKNGNRLSEAAVREMLQNVTYIGKIKYRRRGDGDSQHRTSNLEQFEGQHQAVVDPALFELCQQVRKRRAPNVKLAGQETPMLLKGLVYCYRCVHNPPEAIANFRHWGRMHVTSSKVGNRHRYYNCNAKKYSVSCPQKGIQIPVVEQQVFRVLRTFQPPADWQQRIAPLLNQQFEERHFLNRLAEVYTFFEWAEFNLERGLVTDKPDYILKYRRFKQRILESVPADNKQSGLYKTYLGFASYWEGCEGNFNKQQELLNTLIHKIYIRGDSIAQIDFNGDYTFHVTQPQATLF